MTDRITITGIRGRGRHGVLAAERELGQEFTVDATLDLDLTAAGHSDDLADTVNYAAVAQAVHAIIEGEPVDLIETLAQRCADAILTHDQVTGCAVTVHKPAAPIPVPFTDVTVTIRRERDEPAVVALGGNQGNVASTLDQAVRDLAATPGIRDVTVSGLVETDPVGGPDQPNYLNAVAVLRTSLSPRALLARLNAIEADHGRERLERWGPRTLDLDLVSYGAGATTRRSDDPVLTLPHPRAHQRRFVIEPWAEVDPAATLLVDGVATPVTSLLAGLPDDGVRPGPAWAPLDGGPR